MIWKVSGLYFKINILNINSMCYEIKNGGRHALAFI
jgi:hypothetical protein